MAWDWDYINQLIGDAGNQDTLAGAVTNYALNSGQPEGGLRPEGFAGALLGGATRDQTFSNAPQSTPTPDGGGFGTAAMDWLTRLGQGDKRAQAQARMGLGALGLIGSLTKKSKQKSPAELAAMTRSPYNTWTPDQRQQFDRYFYSQLPQFQYQPPKLYAGGGKVGALASAAEAARAALGAHPARASNAQLSKQAANSMESIYRRRTNGVTDEAIGWWDAMPNSEKQSWIRSAGPDATEADGLAVWLRSGMTLSDNLKNSRPQIGTVDGGMLGLTAPWSQEMADTYAKASRAASTRADSFAAQASPLAKPAYGPKGLWYPDEMTPLGLPGRKPYAAGGNVGGGCACGGLAAYAAGGATHHGANQGPAPVRGPGGGQDDQVPARLSPGEYVFDADVVSALGDGNNEHGAALLDAMRERIRTHKRSAPASKIPPKAHAPEQYLKKGK